LRKRAGFQSDPRDSEADSFAPSDQSFRFAGYLGLANDPPVASTTQMLELSSYVNSGMVFLGRPFDDAWSRNT
jgi:hypothetical protein